MKSQEKLSKTEITFNIGGDHINVKSSYVIRLKETFTLISDEGPIEVEVDITGDMGNVPEKYHEIFLNMMTSKYLNKVSFGKNPFSRCEPITEIKWWEFWKKTKYNF